MARRRASPIFLPVASSLGPLNATQRAGPTCTDRHARNPANLPAGPLPPLKGCPVWRMPRQECGWAGGTRGMVPVWCDASEGRQCGRHSVMAASLYVAAAAAPVPSQMPAVGPVMSGAAQLQDHPLQVGPERAPAIAAVTTDEHGWHPAGRASKSKWVCVSVWTGNGVIGPPSAV